MWYRVEPVVAAMGKFSQVQRNELDELDESAQPPTLRFRGSLSIERFSANLSVFLARSASPTIASRAPVNSEREEKRMNVGKH
jgi:hypothetical protein